MARKKVLVENRDVTELHENDLLNGYTIRNVKRSDGTTYPKLQYAFQYEGKRCFTYGQTMSECKAKAEKKKSDIQRGFISDEEITLDDFFEEIIEKRLKSGKNKPSSAFNRRSIYNAQIKAKLGHKKVKDIQPRDIQKLQNELSERLSTTGVNGTVSLLKDIFNEAQKLDIVSKNPCRAVDRMKRKPTEKEARDTIHRALSDEEIKIFLTAAKNSHYYNLYRFLLVSGMRVGEASALKWNDIDYVSRKIRVDETVTRINAYEVSTGTPKNKAGFRKIQLTPQIEGIIRDQKRQNEILWGCSNSIDMNDLIFKNTSGGLILEQMVLSCMRKLFQGINRDGEVLAYFTPHCFRATYATKCVESGMSIKTLQGLLGHADFSMTANLYAHTTDSAIEREAQKVVIAV